MTVNFTEEEYKQRCIEKLLATIITKHNGERFTYEEWGKLSQGEQRDIIDRQASEKEIVKLYMDVLEDMGGLITKGPELDGMKRLFNEEMEKVRKKWTNGNTQ